MSADVQISSQLQCAAYHPWFPDTPGLPQPASALRSAMIRKTAWLWLSIPAASIAGYLCRPEHPGKVAVVSAAGLNPGPAAKRPIGDVISRCHELKTLVESDADGAE